MKKFPYLKAGSRGSISFARKSIPQALWTHFGRQFFHASTNLPYGKEAAAVASVMVAAWDRQIKAAECRLADPLQREVDRLAALPRITARDLHDMINRVITDQGGIYSSFVDRAVAHVKIADIKTTPFLTHMASWQASKPYDERSLASAIGHVQRFATEVNQGIEALTSAHVQLWLDSQGLDARNTIKNRVYSVKNYWKWMVLRGLAPKTAKPFDDLDYRGRQDADPERFPPEVIQKLIDNAFAIHEPLGYLTKFSAFSGIRREAIGLLKIPDVIWAEVPHFVIHEDKTRAGRRQVPIHSAIQDDVRRLMRKADHGFLIHGPLIGQRTDLLGKRFGKMKRGLGFDDRFNFHSIRRTVIHLLEIAECPESIAQDLVGHKKKSLTYGTYSGLTPLSLRQQWLEKAVRYAA